MQKWIRLDSQSSDHSAIFRSLLSIVEVGAVSPHDFAPTAALAVPAYRGLRQFGASSAPRRPFPGHPWPNRGHHQLWPSPHLATSGARLLAAPPPFSTRGGLSQGLDVVFPSSPRSLALRRPLGLRWHGGSCEPPIPPTTSACHSHAVPVPPLPTLAVWSPPRAEQRVVRSELEGRWLSQPKVQPSVWVLQVWQLPDLRQAALGPHQPAATSWHLGSWKMKMGTMARPRWA
mmetsp:Transcript_21962/g.32854  ORF Transcript_21962/g.32854 Transcript_21962/m.32854 type:complete len:231 (-) Transcript_21962:108-800(-)